MANNFQPETKFTLSSLRRVSDLEKESLMMLYQPILGPTAVSLYLTLEGLETRLRGDSISFGELLRTTRLMKSEFVVALDRLEGIGLINTFQRLAIGEGYDFHLNLEPSLSRDEFLKNEPLATLLLIEMGQEYFSLMVDLTKPYEMEGIGFLEVTKSFYEVFGTPISQVHKEDLEKAMRLANPTGRGLNLQTTPFDFRIFRDVLLKETGLQLETEEQEKVLILAATYGLNEFSFVERLKAVVETGDTHIPFDKLREVLEQNENFRKKVETKSGNLSEISLEGIEERNHALVQRASTNAPGAFLTLVEREKGVSPVKQDRTMLLKAVGSSHLPNEVLNLLVHQILIEEGENSLMQGNFYTRIRDLESAGATTLKKALAFFSDKEATPLQPRKSTKKQRVKTRGGKKEVIPDYVQNREKSEEVTSNNDINEVKDLFNNL